jgi:hypothetical protein
MSLQGTWQQLGAGVNYTWQDPRSRQAGSNYDHILARRARQSGRFDLSYDFGPAQIVATLNAVGPRYDNLANTLRMPGYTTVDLKANVALSKAFALQVKLGNFFDRHYETVRYYNQEGRSINVTLRYQTKWYLGGSRAAARNAIHPIQRRSFIHTKPVMRNDATLSRNELLIGSLLLLALTSRAPVSPIRTSAPRSTAGCELGHVPAGGVSHCQRWWPPVFMLACVAIDYFVIAGGVSAYCFTPAYPFLIPAYLSLWASGRWLQRHTQPLILNVAGRAGGQSACFVISNIGFILPQATSLKCRRCYMHKQWRYWPYYLLHTAIYAGTGLVRSLISHRAAVAQRIARSLTCTRSCLRPITTAGSWPNNARPS